MTTALQHMTECPVCYEDFTDPKILPCDHSLCVNCVNNIKRESRIKCPMCNVHHDADKVRADFRLNQFLDAIKEKEQGTEPPIQQKGSTSKNCELCSTNPVTFICEDCQQWMCTVCKNAHLKSKVCKDHKVTPLNLKNQEIKDTFEKESRKVKDKTEEYSKLIESVEAKSSKINAVKTESLQESSELKKKCMEDLNKFFDAFDTKIVDFAQRNSDELQVEKTKLEQEMTNLQTKWQQLEDMVKGNADELAVQSHSLLDTAKNLLKSQSKVNSHEDMTDMSIDVLPGRTWDPATSATLQLCTAGMRITPCHSTNRKMSELVKEKLRKQTEVSLDRAPKALRLIKQELWSCQDGGLVQIFDQYLEHERNISNEAWGNVYDVAVLPNEELVLACSNGLFHIRPNGEEINVIESGFFSSAIYHNNEIYAYACSPARIGVYKMEAAWVKTSNIRLRCGDWHFVTLSVSSQCIMASYAYEGKIYELSLKGDVLDRHGERGDGNALDGYLGLPFLCQQDQENALLVADFDHHRLLVLDKRGDWEQVDVEPKLVYPRGAVYTGHTLYIASTGRVYTLSAYTQE